MAGTELVQAEVDPAVKIQVEQVLKQEGLSLSEALRIFLESTAQENAIPTRAFHPNAETIEAMEAARRGELLHAESIEQLMADLHADD